MQEDTHQGGGRPERCCKGGYIGFKHECMRIMDDSGLNEITSFKRIEGENCSNCEYGLDPRNHLCDKDAKHAKILCDENAPCARCNKIESVRMGKIESEIGSPDYLSKISNSLERIADALQRIANEK